MKFSASYGTSTKIATTVVCAIFIGVAAIDYSIEGDGAWPLMMMGIMGLLLAVCYVCSVRYYEVTDTRLIIRKPFSQTTLKRADIREVELIDRKALRFAIRTFGIGGVFGYYGEFYTSKLGSMTWYRTRLDNPVLIKTAKRKIVVSPDDAEKFILALQS